LVTGTVKFDANTTTDGSLDYQASNGMWPHGFVTPGSYQKIDAHTAVFAGEITGGSDDYTVNHDGTDYFTVKVVDGARPAAAATSSPCSRTWMAMATGSQAPTPPPHATTQCRTARRVRHLLRRQATDQAWRCGSGIAYAVVVVALSAEAHWTGQWSNADRPGWRIRNWGVDGHRRPVQGEHRVNALNADGPAQQPCVRLAASASPLSGGLPREQTLLNPNTGRLGRRSGGGRANSGTPRTARG